MKTRLLKKIRKQAKEKYRICPFNNLWAIQERVDTSKYSYWRYTLGDKSINLSLEDAIRKLREARDGEFENIARKLIKERDFKRRLKMVKHL